MEEIRRYLGVFPWPGPTDERIESRMKKIHFKKRRDAALSKLQGMQDFIRARMTFLRIKDRRVKAAKVIQKIWRSRIVTIRQMIERRQAKSKAVVTIQTHLRSYLFWKRGLLKKLQLEKLEINNNFWEKVKEKQHKDIVRDIEFMILAYLGRKREKERRLAKTRTFWGLTMKIKQILKEYLRFRKNRNPNKKKGPGFRRIRQRNSKSTLDNLALTNQNSEKTNGQDTTIHLDEKPTNSPSKYSKFRKDSKAKEESVSEIAIEQESVSITAKSKRSSKIEMVPNLSELRQKEEDKSNITFSENNLTNEPNMIADPQRYCDPEKKTLDAISGNIMEEHMAFTKIAQDREKSRQQRTCTQIKTFNPIQMEKEMITPLPGYLQCTTSRLIKEIPVDDRILDEFKVASSQRTKTSRGLKRNDLNHKVDLAEFILSHRSNSNAPKNAESLSKSTLNTPKADFGDSENPLIFNKEIVTPETLEKAEILNDLGLIYEVLTEQKPSKDS